MPRVAFGAFVLMLNYYPPSGGQGISLGLVRELRCAWGAPWGGVGTPPPRSIALVLQKPSFILELLAVRPFASSFIAHQFAILQRVSYCCRSVRVRASAFGAS